MTTNSIAELEQRLELQTQLHREENNAIVRLETLRQKVRPSTTTSAWQGKQKEYFD